MNADRKAAAFANRATQASDLFQMQITELLEGVKPNLKRRLSKLENFLQSLKDRIEGLPSREPVPVRYIYDHVNLQCAQNSYRSRWPNAGFGLTIM